MDHSKCVFPAWENAVSAAELVRDHIDLVSLPEVCLQVQMVADDPHSTAGEMGAVIAQDPALTARLLQLVNSAYFGFPAKVETVTRAVSLVGLRQLRTLALAVSAVELFDRVPPEHVSMVSFWSHSIYCGLLSRELAGACRVLHGERLFVAGLLHDIGRLMIYSHRPSEAERIHRHVDQSGVDLSTAERHVLGYDHAELGGVLLQSWQLPESLQSAVAWHHDAGRAAGSLEAAIVHLANAATHSLEESATEPSYYDPYGPLLRPPSGEPLVCDVAGLDGVAEGVWSITGLGRERVVDAMHKASERFDEVLDLLYPVP